MQKSIHKMEVLLIACNCVIPAKPFVLSPGGGVVKTKPAYFASLLDETFLHSPNILSLKKKCPWFL